MIRIYKSVQSFKYAWKGLSFCFQSENNFKIHCLAALNAIFFGIYFDISNIEWCLIIFAIGIVLITEIINTAIEKIVDFVCPDQNPKAGLIKDISAAAVVMASVVAALIGGIVYLKYVIFKLTFM